MSPAAALTRDDLLIDGPDDARDTFVFAHGAGGPMDAPFMSGVARGFASHGIRVIRFEFPYMRARRSGGKRGGAPDRQEVLLQTWRDAIKLARAQRLIVGGKSMGGRMASMIADEAGAKGLICFSYPFHPPGKPAQTRVTHLQTLATPALFFQGTRDPFGSPDEVATYALPSSIRIEWIDGGDHSLKTPKSSGVTEAERVLQLVSVAAEFVQSVP